MPDSRNDTTGGITRWHWALFVLLQFFNLYQILHHAMWRDELQIWSLVRESGTLAELFHNMRYDGFPPLWYLFLWGISCFTAAPLAMQLFQFTCSFAAQLLVMSRAPFPGNMKLAIVAGYYISFEYCIISRAYVLGVLLTFLFCAFQARLAKYPMMRGAVVGALANTSVYGAILSIAFAMDEIWRHFKLRRRAKVRGERYNGRFTGFLACYGVLLIIALVFMLPPSDGTYMGGWLDFDLTKTIYIFFRNLMFLLPVAVPKLAFWNTLALLDSPWSSRWMAIPGSLVVMVAVWLALRSVPRYLWLFYIGFVGIWIFTAVKYYGYMRHIGAVMVLFIACIWLAAASPVAKQGTASCWANVATWFILAVNVAAWGIASYYHSRYDFSGAREMAGIIQNTSMNMQPIVADSDYAASSVAGYLDRPLYYAANRKPQTFIRWNTERTGGGLDDALNLAHDLSVGNNSGVLLLLNYKLEDGLAKLLAHTRDAIVADEVFYLYEYNDNQGR